MTLDKGSGRELGDPNPTIGGSIGPGKRSRESLEDLIDDLTGDDDTGLDFEEPDDESTEPDFTKGSR